MVFNLSKVPLDEWESAIPSPVLLNFSHSFRLLFARHNSRSFKTSISFKRNTLHHAIQYRLRPYRTPGSHKCHSTISRVCNVLTPSQSITNPHKYFPDGTSHNQTFESKIITNCLSQIRQSTAAANALISYLEDLSTNTAFLSAISAIETDSAAVSSLSAFEASVSSVFENQETLATDYLKGVPETVRPFFSSVYQAEASILTANGFSNPLKSVSATVTSSGTGTATGAAAQATSSSTAGAAARETGLGRVGQVAVAGAVGFVGIVMAL